MILTKNSIVNIMESPMTRRFCETRIMTEYHTRKPYFINAAMDDLVPACSQSSVPSDEIWNKFELFLTPPSSPPRENDEQSPQMVPDSTDATLTSGIDFDALGIDLNAPEFTQDPPSLHDTIYPEKTSCESCECISARKKLIKKDCMWNGVGSKSTISLRNSRNRRRSPGSHSPCHANGCVDPRNIFPYPVGQPNCCENQRRKTSTLTSQRHRMIVDGAETPSDSDEEIDVVTVDNKTQTSANFKPRNGIINGNKVITALVPRQNGELTLVTTTRGAVGYGGLKPISGNAENERGRARSKYHVFGTNAQNLPSVTMVTEKASKIQKDEIDTANLGIKRRHTVEDVVCCANNENQQQIMQMANPKLLMQRNDSTSPVSRIGEKRRILSLDGVSFCATNRQYNAEYNRPKEAPKMSSPAVINQESIDVTKLKSTKPQIQVTDITRVKATKAQLTESIVIKEEYSPPNPPRIITSPQNKRKRKAEVLNVIQSSGSGSESENIRAAHNVLERQRREGLRAAFHTLRDNVPELQAMEKTPKVNILNKARDHCLELQKNEVALLKEKERLLRRQQKLKHRVELARKSVHVVCPLESDLESDGDDSITSGESPMSSLPPSPNASFIPNRYYVTNGRLSKEELVLRLETLGDRQRHKERPAVKQVKCQTNLRALFASLQKSENTNVRLSIKTSDVMSDGYECVDSEEEQYFMR